MIWMCLFPSAKVKCSLALQFDAQTTPSNGKKPIWTLQNNLTQFRDTSTSLPWYSSHLNNLYEGKEAKYWAKQRKEPQAELCLSDWPRAWSHKLHVHITHTGGRPSPRRPSAFCFPIHINWFILFQDHKLQPIVHYKHLQNWILENVISTWKPGRGKHCHLHSLPKSNRHPQVDLALARVPFSPL